ncbi:hypothetical protein [Streptomyces turgidiscabies]|uniref:hypothetical protein n=1 Tax=Streptomyces turgidiscabies TaxID=85558 RepID=UPI0038F73291
MTEQPETWRTDPRERLLAAIDRTWARGELGATPEQLVDGYARHLAEQQRNHWTPRPPGKTADYVRGLDDGFDQAADLIDPEAQR